ncbi:cysteine desulfurase [Rubrivirga sp.]|uniref:cysteine desulfurase n=1 Tax=Rubrivirga sp. TaxID=1885344 RepID=UPI003B515D47
MPATAALDVAALRADFPILQRTVHDGRPLVYLDNAATTQKPRVVLDRLAAYYGNENANVHRGVHVLSAEGTEAYEHARRSVQRFLGAEHAREVVFTRGTTEAINLVAHGLASFLEEGDEIVVSALEHHANIVPWQMAAERTGARLRVIPVLDTGDLDLSTLDEVITDRTKVVAVTHTSNALGTVVDLAPIVAAARAVGAAVLIDGAQAAPHTTVDVQALGADFFVFSGHKTFGPTGIGALWGREAWLERLPPYQGGGDMIDRVTFEKTTFAGLPAKFEAGTPHVAGGIGLGTALDYLMEVGMDAVEASEHELIGYAEDRLGAVDGLRFVGTPRKRAGAISFVLDGIHPYDAGTVLDRLGIAVRTGQHCAQPVMDRFGVDGTIRASFALYNTPADVDALVEGLATVRTMFG